MRKTIFWLHLVTGVVAGIVILIMSVTGVLLTYQRQITAWSDGSRVTAPAEAVRLPIEKLLADVSAREKKPPTAITISSDPGMATTFSYGREKILFVDPYTGTVVSEGSKKVRAFFQSMINWHRWLALDGDQRPIGKAITGACNLGFLFLVVSGFYLWWPRSWNTKAFKSIAAFNFSLTGKARDFNWHNTAGFWMAIPLLVVVSTATFFSYPWTTNLLYRAMGHDAPQTPARPPSGAPAEETKPKSDGASELTGLDRHWATAASHVAGWNTISLRVPASSREPLSFTIDKGNGARPDLRSQITINSATGAITKTESYADYNAPRKVRLWVRWLHTGEAGGWIGQTLAGIASGAGALLVWTGLALAWRRFFKPKGEPVIA